MVPNCIFGIMQGYNGIRVIKVIMTLTYMELIVRELKINEQTK